MRSLLLLVTIIGFSEGFQYPLEYQYRYYSTLANGIPELSDQASGVGLRGDVTVQVHEDGTALFQFTNVEIAQFNDRIGCDLRQDINVEFKSFEKPEIQAMIEEPFEVHLATNDEVAIIVGSDELMWISNVRKGIVGVARNEVIRGNFKDPENYSHKIASLIHEGNLPNSFQVVEETLYGNCNVDYTVHKLPEHIRVYKNHLFDQSIEEDVQRQSSSASSPYKTKSTKKTTKKSPRKSTKSGKPGRIIKKHPSLKNDLWHVVRTVNFDECTESVAFQETLIGIKSSLHGDQYEWLRGRSSVSELILRGSPGAFRIEQAIIEGATLASPFGTNTKSLQSRTNQTYELVAVREAKRPLKLQDNTKIIKTWMHQFYSPAPPPKINKPLDWVIYSGKTEGYHYVESLGGAPLTSEDFMNIKKSVIDLISKASLYLSDMEQEYGKLPPGEAVNNIHLASMLMKGLSKKTLLEIFDHFDGKKVHSNEVINSLVVVDAFAAAATDQAIFAIMELIQKEKIPYSQIFTISMTLTNNLGSPVVLPALMDYVMSLDMNEKPFLTSTVLVNFASVLHNLCIDPKATKVTYAGNLFSDYTCDLEIIKKKFVPYLTNIIFVSGKDWQKELAIHALGELGTPFSIPLLERVILGKTQCSTAVRLIAIYSLDSSKLYKHVSSHVRNEIMSIMMDVFSNLGEDPEIRQGALVVISTWGPKPSFWHRIARSSWREPSRQVAAYITTFLEAVANMKKWKYVDQSQAATSALNFAKPVSPMERLSFVFADSQKAFDRQVSKLSIFEWIQETDSPHSLNAYLLLMMNVGGFEMVNFELGISENIVETVYNRYLSSKSGATLKQHRAAAIAKQFFQKISDTVNIKEGHPEGETASSSGNIMIKAFENMQLYVPLHLQNFQNLYDRNAIAEIAVQLSLGYDYTIAKFFNPISLGSFHPSDVGLPIYIALALPMVVTDLSYTTVSSGAKTMNIQNILDKAEAKSESISNLVSQSISGIYTYVPWTGLYASVEVKCSREISLPLIYTLRTDRQKGDSSEHFNTHLDIESYYKKKFTVLRAATEPSTSHLPFASLPSLANVERKPIVHKPTKEFHMELPQVFTGLKFDFTWKSSLPFPLNFATITEIFGGDENALTVPLLTYALGSPTVEEWYFELNFDPASSQTKNMSIGISIGSFGKEEKSDISQMGQNQDEIGQETGDFFQESQGFDIDQEAEDFDSKDSVEQIEATDSVIFGDTYQKRSEKLKHYYGGTVFSASLTATLVGDKERNYEILVTKAKPHVTTDRKLIKSQVAFYRGPIPGRDDKPLSVCLDLKKTKPRFSALDTIQSLLSRNLNSNVEAELTVDCSGEPDLSIKGEYHLSEKAKAKLLEEVNQSCDYDTYNEVHTLHDLAVYDNVKYDFSWKEVCDMKKVPLLTKTFDYIHRAFSVFDLNKGRCGSYEPSKELHASLNRCTCSNTWKLNVERDGKQISYKDKELDDLFNYLYHIGKNSDVELNEGHPNHYSVMGHESTKCSIDTSHVRTFDGFTYDYNPTKCWSVAYKDCSETYGAMLLVRSSTDDNTIPEVRYISKHQQFVVDIEPSGVRVNGKIVDMFGESEDVKDEDGEIIATVYHINDHFMVKFSSGYYVAVTDKVQIKLPFDYQTKLCGLCGNFNGEKFDDMIGPQKCLHSDPNTFVASWSAPSDTCDTYAIFDLREKVMDYQKSCPTMAGKNTCSSSYNDHCVDYHWKIMSDSEIACISQSPIPYCEGPCIAFESQGQKVIYQCWKKELAPADLTTALERNHHFMQKKIQIEEHFLEIRYNVTLPSVCKSFTPISERPDGMK